MGMKKIWQVDNSCSDSNSLALKKEIAESLGISELCAALLVKRGCNSTEKAKSFIDKSDLGIYDPFKLPDMEKAAKRIVKAVEDRENVAIYGDYDVDGVSSTAVLYLYLEELCPELELGYYIPDRFAEGYGMSMSAIEMLANKGVKLIITVDTGITAVKEVEYAKSLGMDVVISDHHECPEVLPSACAVVDPHRADSEYPFEDLAGVGVAFKLVTAIEMMVSGKSRVEAIKSVYNRFADLATLGTIADVMPVTDENRNIIHYGLLKLRRSPRPGVKALLDKAGIDYKKCNSSNVSFAIAPRINAAGRMKHAAAALELMLLCDDDCAETADSLAEMLCEYNKARREEEQRILEQIYKKIDETHDFENDKVIVVSDDNWHPGVIGIVASRVAERYGLPSILITFWDEENVGSSFDKGRGSGRSVEGINLVEALSASSKYLVKFGGHEQAAGLSLTRADVDDFKREINSYIRSIESPQMWTTATVADMELKPIDVCMRCAEDISLLEPFGESNPTPLFYMSDVSIVKSYAIGGGKHLKFVFEKDEKMMNAVMFSADYEAFNYIVGDKVDIMCNMDVNEYNGYRSVQLVVREIRTAESVQNDVMAQKARYEQIMAGADFSREENIIPDREEFVVVYKQLKLRESTGQIGENELLSASGHGINRIKLCIILDVFAEMGLCLIRRGVKDVIEYEINKMGGKVDIMSSDILKELISREK